MAYSRKVIANFVKKHFPEEVNNYRVGDKSYRVNSLFDKEDRKKHLYIFVDGGGFRCFKTGKAGSFEFLVKVVDRLPGDMNEESTQKRIDRHILAKYYVIKEKEFLEKVNNLIRETTNIRVNLNKIDLPEGTYPLTKETEINKKFFNYLEGRGITREMIKRFRMGYCVKGTYTSRVIIPIYDNKKIVYFMSRDITDKSSKKYLNPSRDEVQGNGTGAIVFNLDHIKAGDTVVITEGIFNAFHNTEENVVLCSIFGKTILYNQLKKILKKKPKAIILGYDNDKYFEKSTADSYNFIKNELKNSEETEVYILNWDWYEEKYKKGICDFGDLYKDTNSLPIKWVEHSAFIKKYFI